MNSQQFTSSRDRDQTRGAAKSGSLLRGLDVLDLLLATGHAQSGRSPVWILAVAESHARVCCHLSLAAIRELTAS
jgi:hypothetical protein